MKPQEIKDLQKAISRFGGKVPLQLLLDENLAKMHTCPLCKGKGIEEKIEYDYMSHRNSPSYGTERRATVQCSLCEGIGKTEREYKPKMVQQGWE